MWLVAVGARTTTVYSVSVLRPTSLAGYTSPPIPPSLPPPSNPAVKDRIGRLEEMMADLMVMMREMQASSSTTGPSQSTVSSTAPAQPPTDTYPPNNDEMGGVKSTELTHGDYHMEALEAWSTSHHKPCPVQPKYEARMVSFKKRIRPLSLHNRARRIKDPIFWCGVDELWRIPVLESCVNKRRKEEESINFKESEDCPKFREPRLVLDKPLPTACLRVLSEECITFQKWLQDNHKVRSIILASMTNDIQKQYDRYDVPLIMLRMKEVYAFPDRHINMPQQKHSSGPHGSSVQSHGVKMLSLVEKLEDLKVGVDNDTYIDKEKGKVNRATASTKGAPAAADGKGKGKGKVRGSQRLKANDVCMNCQEKGIGRRSVHNSFPTQVLGRSRKLSKDEMILRLGDRKAVVAEAVGSLNLVIGDHIRIELKDCYSVPSMIKNIISIPILYNNGYAFKINKNGFYLMIDDNYHLFGTLGYALETAAKFLNMAPSKMVYRISKRKWDTTSMIHPSKIFISRNAVFLKKSFSLDNRRDEVLLEESSEPPQQNNTTSLEPSFPTDGVPFLCISTRESRLPERYGFVGLTSQLDNDPKTYGEAMSDIDSDKWLEAMKSKMDSIDSNQVWTLVDPPKVKPVMDVKMAFLNGYVEEDIFMDQSEDFTSVGEEQKDMGEASYILGIKIYRDRSRKMLGLTQSSYIEKVLKRFKMENSKRGFFQ
ncbi:UNVERIFIED_CONTAM: hypothetical protein Scaly_3105200 [Sesamum calycinum]|uniref:Reverse transcriptase Ty1/copia-type domain-containing protein n=1 Tax=Sesamum calycinum TaxID=2727403 RepID=A0AAW2JMZ5_9LAMI